MDDGPGHMTRIDLVMLNLRASNFLFLLSVAMVPSIRVCPRDGVCFSFFRLDR